MLKNRNWREDLRWLKDRSSQALRWLKDRSLQALRWLKVVGLRILHWLFVMGAILGYAACVLVPILMHNPGIEGEAERRAWCCHQPIFHTSSYANPLPGLIINDDRVRFHGGEIWELWAIVQALFATLLIQAKARGRALIWMAISSAVLSFFALATLGFHDQPWWGRYHVLWYGAFLILALIAFTACDRLLWKEGHVTEDEFTAMFVFVDIPSIIGLFVFFVYVYIWISAPFVIDRQGLIGADFISGAIAFQLILSNVLLLIIKFGISDRILALATRGSPGTARCHGGTS